MAHRSYRWLLFSIALVGFAADQGSKYGMFNWLYSGQVIGQRDVIPGVFKFLVQYDRDTPACDCAFVKWNGPVPPRVNHGALFSLGGEFKADANKFFATVSVLAAVGISLWGMRRATGRDGWLCICLGLILAGTVGNLFDRIVFGGVRDFLYFYAIEWPVFNVADCCLVIGAIMLLLQALFGKKPEPSPSAQSAPTMEPPPAA